MDFSILFFTNSILLGVGLAMDAFSVSVANGIVEKDMKSSRMVTIAGCFALFQFAMPMIGWSCVHTIVTYFKAFEKCIPWIALILLCYIGGSMIWGCLKGEEEEEKKSLSGFALCVAGVATSIDALSVGFAISEYGLVMAFVAAVIIAIVTFFICMAGINIGKKFGDMFGNKAELFGGIILIGIGLEIFIKGVFF